MPIKVMKPVADFVEDERVEFMAVICTAMKPNAHFCNSHLGDIETSRPNVSKHRCRTCKITYRHEVDSEGCVSCAVLKADDYSPKPMVKSICR